MIEQNVEVVVAKDALRPACINQGANQIDDCRAVWPSVGQVAQESESSALAMTTVLVLTQVLQQRAQSADLTVDITHDVERTVEEGLNESGHEIVTLVRGRIVKRLTWRS